jgi:hypothetical protein
MEFINDYKNMGGRVTPSTDAGFIYNTYGFSYVEELENFQEAGFHPLEVIRAATLHSAEEIFRPTGRPIEYGVVRPGMRSSVTPALRCAWPPSNRTSRPWKRRAPRATRSARFATAARRR